MRKYLLPMFLASLDTISVILAAFISIYLRFDSDKIPANYLSLLISYMPLAVAIYLISFYLFKLYGRIWRYASATELIAIVMANIAASTAWYFISLYIGAVLPRSLYVFTGLLLIFFIGGSRLSLRFYSYIMNKPKYRQIQRKKNKVLIIGAGDAGAMLLREIERYHIANRQVVGFIDDDKNKTGKILLGVKVLGTRNELVKIASEKGIDEIIIAMPSVKGKEIKAIINICKETNCKLTILPGLYEIIEGKVSISQLRPVDIEDLLGRDPVKLDTTAVKEYLAGKIVLITGAGGSIGSEIVRQVAKMQPKKLLLLGKGENSIYEITQELKINCPEVKTVPIIADIRDKERIKAIMDYFKPQVVFHAAAHKHVPLMEYQPAEAVRNNILGTKVVADEAAEHNVETFVMISTDKAVNPTSVMGCTKRVAEMYVQSMNKNSGTRFVAVRFGNVLGSRGSVIPLFKKQIAKGGEVFVLDMGEPVRIYDLAKDLITLSGLIPDKDIEIKITGLRPGEKLFEELLSAEDGTEKTTHKKIFTARIKEIDKAGLDREISKILEITDGDEVVAALQKIVPTYTPNRENI